MQKHTVCNCDNHSKESAADLQLGITTVWCCMLALTCNLYTEKCQTQGSIYAHNDYKLSYLSLWKQSLSEKNESDRKAGT